MVFEQCIACNVLKTDSGTTCVCGHVFENSKQIGGKRFSEYRAELYSRLEKRRMRKLTRENRKAGSDKQRSQPLKERKTNTTNETCVIRSSFKPRTHTASARSKAFNRKIKTKTFSRPGADSVPSKTAVPPELVSRLPSALQEINRRLTGQNLMWWTTHWLQ
ncbi:uncharacterized protein LOC110052908 isoform X2 [Orbicella faveolata]|uniref:uncharacterized protein LOC110052908 isoform X2 n=1 Tax=Orbicella faveolata TaxID=48498 RepID=UPI0009E1E9D3|nr:uncharacterized protein LOC110052908 isoform X2 [Orbicella faveolata]